MPNRPVTTETQVGAAGAVVDEEVLDRAELVAVRAVGGAPTAAETSRSLNIGISPQRNALRSGTAGETRAHARRLDEHAAAGQPAGSDQLGHDGAVVAARTPARTRPTRPRSAGPPARGPGRAGGTAAGAVARSTPAPCPRGPRGVVVPEPEHRPQRGVVERRVEVAGQHAEHVGRRGRQGGEVLPSSSAPTRGTSPAEPCARRSPRRPGRPPPRAGRSAARSRRGPPSGRRRAPGSTPRRRPRARAPAGRAARGRAAGARRCPRPAGPPRRAASAPGRRGRRRRAAAPGPGRARAPPARGAGSPSPRAAGRRRAVGPAGRGRRAGTSTAPASAAPDPAATRAAARDRARPRPARAAGRRWPPRGV